jgi:hypothetical protein
MPFFLAAAALIVGLPMMGFEQGQANPNAESFLESKSTAYQD